MKYKYTQTAPKYEYRVLKQLLATEDFQNAVPASSTEAADPAALSLSIKSTASHHSSKLKPIRHKHMLLTINPLKHN